MDKIVRILFRQHTSSGVATIDAMTHLRAQKKISAKNIYLHFIVRYTNKPQPIVRVLIQSCKSMQSKGNVTFSGFKNTHWLRYSISKDTVYCPSCVVFGSNVSRDKTNYIPR